MVKRLNMAFDDSEHKKLFENKESVKKNLGLDRLSWENYFLYVCGVKSLKDEGD